MIVIFFCFKPESPGSRYRFPELSVFPLELDRCIRHPATRGLVQSTTTVRVVVLQSESQRQSANEISASRRAPARAGPARPPESARPSNRLTKPCRVSRACQVLFQIYRFALAFTSSLPPRCAGNSVAQGPNAGRRPNPTSVAIGPSA